jgi:spore germination protein KA
MFNYIGRKIKFWKLWKNNKIEDTGSEQKVQPEFSQDLEKNINTLQSIISKSSDIIVRRFAYGYINQTKAAVIFIDGLIDKALVNENIMKTLMFFPRFNCEEKAPELHDIYYIKTNLLSVVDIEETAYINEAVDSILSGDTRYTSLPSIISLD